MHLLITGAASGIGAAAARRMARARPVILADRDLAGVEAIASELRSQGHRAHAVEMDVTSRESVARAFGDVETRLGPIEALFNNAGVMRARPVQEIPREEWQTMLSTHVKGAFLCAQAVLPAMCAARKGAIVNMASDFAIAGMPGGAAYAAAKAAVYSLTKSLALEFAGYGIRVNALGPGPIDTPLLRGRRSEEEWPAAEASLAQKTALERLGNPDEVAAVLEFLLSDRASYITGQILHPNGGQLTW